MLQNMLKRALVWFLVFLVVPRFRFLVVLWSDVCILLCGELATSGNTVWSGGWCGTGDWLKFLAI
jgi:hypothetical protein